MNISKNRLQGFTSGTPAYVILHGLLNLTRGHHFAASFEGNGNPVAAFREAVTAMQNEHRSEKSWYYARPIPRELSDALERARSVGEAHRLIHQELSSHGYSDTHVNTCSAMKLLKIDRATRHSLSQILPEDEEGDLLIITGRSPDGLMVLLTN